MRHRLRPGIWVHFTVDPALQNSGFGRKLLCAAEEYAAVHGARRIEMTVVNVRETLIFWYERRGYSPNRRETSVSIRG